MESVFKIWKTNRALYLRFFDYFTLEQLNKIPEGFSNNLIWNIGHVIVTQQLLVYQGSNLPMQISDKLVELYKPSTKPTENVSQAEVDELKALLISVMEQTIADFEKGLFTTYNEKSLASGFNLATVKDAFEFNNYHEALHLGYIMSIKKFI